MQVHVKGRKLRHVNEPVEEPQISPRSFRETETKWLNTSQVDGIYKEEPLK
jgi:hypothetical protein